MIKTINTMLLFYALSTTFSLANNSEKISLGVQSSYLSYGLSAKYDVTDKVTAQGVIGFSGRVNNYSLRGLYDYYTKPNLDVYAFGSVGMWTWDNYLYDESVVGFGAGTGVEYDLRGIDKDLPAILVSAELGLNIVNFDHYNNFSALGLGLGIHYKF